MVQSYLRYEHDGSFGVISSPAGNVLYDKTGKYAIAPALENIIVWNVRQGTQERVLKAPEGEVLSLALSNDGNTVAAGYSNGVIRLFTLSNGKLLVTLDGHKSHVETLSFSADGSILASGARDTHIIVWDLVTQSGLYRLKGHRDAVTCVRFANDQKILISASKDTLLKVWDLETQHCVQTCVGHRSEIWSFDLNKDQTRIATCSSDNQLRIYSINPQEVTTAVAQVLTYMGSLFRQSNERASQLSFGPTGQFMACQTVGKCVEVYKIRTEEEMKKKQTRRLKRQREKAKAKSDKEIVVVLEQAPAVDPVNDELELLTVIHTTHKLRSFCFAPMSPTDEMVSLLFGLINNSLEVYSFNRNEAQTSYSKAHSVALQGHRSDVRNVSLSSDNQLILSISNSSAKVWNARSMQCVRTMSTSVALCGVFAPGNRHVVIGTKAGKIQVFDLASGQCTLDTDAHEGAVWSIDVRPDGKGIMSGGADHEVKFWDFDMVLPTEGSQIRTLSLVHMRTLKMSDDVLCVRYSHSKDASKLLVAVALLDCTVKVFYDDSLKFFLSLYGHKLPVMAMDISSDDTMLVTASADKNVKLWGLDFGDCHKSIYAHENSIMAVRFVHKTHYFFTASKDKTIRYWDGDNFERILTLKAHFGEVWGLAVSSDGSYLISVSHDRSLRKWIRTSDQVFLEEEREKELENMFESELNGKAKKEDDAETAPAGKRSVETVKAGEQIMEALELADSEQQVELEFQQKLKAAEAALSVSERQERQAALERKRTGAEIKEGDLKLLKPLVVRPKPNMLLLGFTPMKYVLRSLNRIRSHEMEEALIVLPFDTVQRLISYLLQLVRANIQTEKCLNCLLYLLRVHHEQIIANRSLLHELDEMWLHLRQHIAHDKDTVGFNLAGMRFLKRRVIQSKTVYLDDSTLKKQKV